MCKVIAVANQKGGVGKTTTTVNIGVGLVKRGNKVLLIDADPQGSLTISLGIHEPDQLNYTISNIMLDVVNEDELPESKGIIRHKEGVDFIPSNIELSGLEVSLVNVMSRELVLREFIKEVKGEYDYILIDCMPSLGMITINALACADTVLIPVQVSYLPVKGLQQLIKTISRVKKQLNPELEIEGIILTMVDYRTNYAKDIATAIFNTYSNSVNIFSTVIPTSVRAAEQTIQGTSIYEYNKRSKVAIAYENLTEEVLEHGNKREN